MKFKENDWVYVIDEGRIHFGIVTYQYDNIVNVAFPVCFNSYSLNGKRLEQFEEWSTDWEKYKDYESSYKERLSQYFITENYLIEPKELTKSCLIDHVICQKLVNEGKLVPKTFRTPWFTSELDKNKQFRLVLKWVNTSNNIGKATWRNGRGGYRVTQDKVFYTYAEAETKLNEIKKEAKRFASLSELEQCLEEHEHYLSRYFDKEIVQLYLNKIKSMDNAEDVEIKISNHWSEDGSYAVYWHYFAPYSVKPLGQNNNHKETKAEKEARNKAWAESAKERWFEKWKELKV